MNRFAHLKQHQPDAAEPDPPQTAPPTMTEDTEPGATPTPERTRAARPARATAPKSADPAPVSEAPAETGEPLTLTRTDELELQEVAHLVERRVGILGRVPASLKDDYDEMLLRARKYIGRPNADLALQAWVELTLEDEALQRRWLRRIQDLKRK